jgi:hypothetical protein
MVADKCVHNIEIDQPDAATRAILQMVDPLCKLNVKR